jgi:hypothetical protein
MATEKQQVNETKRVKVADDKKVQAALDKVRKRDQELLKRLAR